MKVYKLFYYDEYEHPDDIEIVSQKGLAKFVAGLPENCFTSWIASGHGYPQTETECVDFLEENGWYVSLSTVIE